MWGVGYLVATGWMTFLPHPELAWPITMVASGLFTGLGMWLSNRNKASPTDTNHSTGGIWAGVGFSFIPIILCGNTFSPVSIPVVFFIVLGIANFASGVVLRWRSQRIVAVLWWVCAVALARCPPADAPWVFVANAVICQIAFGIYLTVLERKGLSGGRAA